MSSQIERVQIRRAVKATLSLPPIRINAPATVCREVRPATLSSVTLSTRLMTRCPQSDLAMALGRATGDFGSLPRRARKESRQTSCLGVIWNSWVDRFLRPNYGHTVSADALAAIPARTLLAAHVVISLVMSLTVTAFVGSFLMVLFQAIS